MKLNGRSCRSVIALRRRRTTHARWHDQALWFMRAKRDASCAGAARNGRSCASSRRRSRRTRCRTWPSISSSSSATPRVGATSTGPATPPSTTRSCSASCTRTACTRCEEQVDAHRGVRPQPVTSSGTASRSSTPTSASGSCSFAERAAQPHRAAGDPHQEGGSRRAVPRAARHRPQGATDPQYLAEAARQHLREKFLARRGGHHRRELRHRRNRRLRRLHERRQRRPRRVAAASCTSPAWASKS